MTKEKDITNQTFNKLTAKRKVDERRNGKIQYLFKCLCGNEKIIISSKVISGQIKSCGDCRKRISPRDCKNCKKEFKPEYNDAIFCSLRCYNDYKRENEEKYLKGRFEKGRISKSPNEKGFHFSPKTEFKKGERNIKSVDVGTISLRKDGRNFIKIEEPNKWMTYSVYLWESYYGKVSKGMVVHHVNFIKNDDRIENFALLTRKEHINIHRLHKKEMDNGG